VVGRPAPGEFASYYATYIALVPEDDIIAILERQVEDIRRMAGAVPADRETYRSGPDKWSVREVFGHLGDAERVFGYRAACVSRGDTTPLPGFDENLFVANAGFDRSDVASLAAELTALRASNLAMFRRLDDREWRIVGTANGQPVSVRALAHIMAGHVAHHFGILAGRYGLTP
jgi:hypothetical protein